MRLSSSSNVVLGALCASLAGGCNSGAPAPAPPPSAPAGPAGPAHSASAAADAPLPAASAAGSVVAPPSAAAPPAGVAHLEATGIALPGATGPAGLDYIAADRARSRVWVPVSVTGSVDVLDVATRGFVRVDGFKTAEREVRGKKRTVGPTAVTIGDGVAYVGNRGTNEVCAVDLATLKVGACVKMRGGIDGVAYVAPSKEVWVTMPAEHALGVLDASKPAELKAKPSIAVAGEPEGYAVDEGRGLFFTNLEDQGGTLAIDARSHAVKATWRPGCASDGPRGVAVDAARSYVLVACTDHVQVLDAAHDGALLGRLDVGGGVDNIDYLPAKKLVYAAAGKAGRLTIARVEDGGQLVVVATAETAAGARNTVADGQGNAYVTDTVGARLLVVPSP